MSWRISPTATSYTSYSLAGISIWTWSFAVLAVVLLYATLAKRADPYASIPAVGRTGFIPSFIDGVRALTKADIMLQEGYRKYKNSPGIFRLPEMNRWHVVVCGVRHIEDIRKAPDDVLSIDEATKDILALDYTLGPNLTTDMYHIPVIRSQLTRNLAAVFPDMWEELGLSFEDEIPVTEDWRSVKVLEAMMKIVSRTSNRIFVGVPTCRNPEYVMLNIRFTIDVVIGAKIIKLFPDFLKPLAGRFLTWVPRQINTGLKHLGPIIEERQRKIDEYGFDYPDKPNDMVSWLLDEARGEQRSTQNIALRVLALNFAAIHTSSLTVTHALFHLASRPEYIQPIRAEIEAVIAEEGWSKVAMTRMRKLDSFMKESQRMDGFGGVSMSRIVMKDFTFSDGTTIPKGGFVSAVALGIHFDGEFYDEPETFNGFRFSNLREEAGEGTKNQMVATSSEYLPFGHGKHACPGRFFAANELKAMMAHMVLTYDIKMAKEGERPRNQWHGFTCVPDPKGEVLFRKRRA